MDLPQNLYASPFNSANISTVLPKESHSSTFTRNKVIQAISATPHMSEMDDSGLQTGSRFSVDELCLCNVNEQFNNALKCETHHSGTTLDWKAKQISVHT